MRAITISFLVAIFIIFAFVLFVSYMYAKKIKKEDAESEDFWLFKDFYLDLYRIFFKDEDPEQIATEAKIDLKEYITSCKIARVEPNIKKIIVNYAIGFLLFPVVMLLSFVFGSIMIPASFFVLLYFSFYERKHMKFIADQKQREIERELPRFLGILKSVLAVGISIDNAIILISKQFDSLLSREFEEAMNKANLGIGNWQTTLLEISNRYEVETLSSFIIDITKSHEKGVNIASIVEQKYHDIYDTTMLNIEEKASKQSTYVLFVPVVFQILPAIIMMIAPVFIELSKM